MKSFVLLSVLAVLIACAYALTVCEEHKQNARPSAHGFSFNVTCDESGNYLPFLCTPDHISPKWCACFMPNRQMSTMSTNVKRCECHLAKGAAEDAGKTGCDLPQCAPDGRFKLFQKTCAGKRHCVHPLTGVKTIDLTDPNDANGLSCPTA